jgi:hypothetical protein
MEWWSNKMTDVSNTKIFFCFLLELTGLAFGVDGIEKVSLSAKNKTNYYTPRVVKVNSHPFVFTGGNPTQTCIPKT